MTRPCVTAPSSSPCPSPWRTSSPSPGSSTRSAWPTSRPAGPAPSPRTPSSSAAFATISTCAPPGWWPSAPPAGPGPPPPTTPRCAPSSTPAPPSSPLSPSPIRSMSSGRCVPPARRTCAWCARPSGCSSPPAARSWSTLSTTSTAWGTTPATACRWRSRLRAPAPAPSSPATPTAAPCPTASAGASASCARLWTRTAGPAAWSGSTPTTTPGWRSPAPWRPSRPAPGRCRAASTASASAPATPTS